MYMERSTQGIEDKCIHFFVGKPEGERPLGIPRRMWEDNIEMDPRQIE
jgi:hypothetical protein